MRTCVIIPTYNEAKTIAKLIRQIRSQGLEVVVVDDGSADSTSKISQDNGALVLRNSNNEGKGASLIRGFNYALSKDFDAIVTMDGDGQHLPEDILYFTQLAQYSDNGVFIGNRMLNIKNMPWMRLVTNKFMSWFISRVTKQDIPDTQCGFRLIKKSVFEKLNLRTTRYETESELLIEASRLGFKIESVPVNTVYLGAKSQINPVLDTLRFIRFIHREIFRRTTNINTD